LVHHPCDPKRSEVSQCRVVRFGIVLSLYPASQYLLKRPASHMEFIHEALGRPFTPARLSFLPLYHGIICPGPYLFISFPIFSCGIATAVLRLVPSVWRACPLFRLPSRYPLGRVEETQLKASASLGSRPSVCTPLNSPTGMILPLELHGTTKGEGR